MSIVRQLKSLKKIIQPRNGHFDSSDLYIFSALFIEEGVLIFYYVKNPFLLGAVLLDTLDSKTILWRTVNPIWHSQENIQPLKISQKTKVIYFHYRFKKASHSIKFSLNYILGLRKIPAPPVLKRISKNPILKPNPHNEWEASAVFNSGALYLDNRVHFIYRAIMPSGVSVFGYASSNDGININERSTKPVYLVHDAVNSKNGYLRPFFSSYVSGNSWCGCEDPRLTQIGDTIYMTYIAWNSASAPHMALTSIKTRHFLKKKWEWKKPIQISPPCEMHKNWVIFPEKINGKYAILHSLTPHILIEYLDTFESNIISIKSNYQPDKRDMYWDSRVRGAGPPPIKTSEGWLVIYHAMDWKDPNRYKIGAMILDLKNPEKVLYRTSKPILEPDAMYENVGHKAGVIYTCGAVIIDDTLFVYYGGADTVLCAARHNLNKLLFAIKNSQIPFTKL